MPRARESLSEGKLSMSPGTYRAIEGQSTGFGVLSGGLLVLVGLGFYAAHYIDTHGHYVTGISNQVVWGLPHIFAVFLIVAASGALNVASLGSVFGRETYKPLARMSGVLAITLLLGGLAILVLDLGRPDRLIVALTHYNFKSIFAWNIFLYTGFVAITVVYLWMLMERRFNRYARTVGALAFIWRIVLTTATGCIFGFLVARQSYDAVTMAPLFLAMSLSFGLAVFILVAVISFRGAGYAFPGEALGKLRYLLGCFSAAVFLLVVIQHLTTLYVAEHQAVERFLLLDGGIYPLLFWVGQIGLGTVLPLLIAFHRRFAECTTSLMMAAGFVVVGGFCQLYVLIVGGQAYPLMLSRQFEVVESTFFDGVVATYVPSLAEIGLGVGGLALALFLYVIGLKIFYCLPDNDNPATN